MAPTEETILLSFLLQKAGLRDVLTLAEFSGYFPPSRRSSPLVRHLYRDLQSQRNTICDSVLKQIKLECRLGENLVANRRAERGNSESTGQVYMENDVEIQLFGHANAGVAVPLALIVPAMENAADELRELMDKTQQEVDSSLMLLQRISGSMSDLKYGSTDHHITEQLKVQTSTSLGNLIALGAGPS